MNSKDQSGAAASGEWLLKNGAGTYGSRANGESVEERVTRPISRSHFDSVVGCGKCLRCGGQLKKMKAATGGYFWSCEDGGHQCYYISFRPVVNRGEERVIKEGDSL